MSNFTNSFSCILSVDSKGRVDDNISTIQKRLKVYFECTLPVINYYSAEGNVRKVNDLLHKASDCNIPWEMVTLPFASE